MMANEPAWSDADLSANPHASADKARRVRSMFSAIAPSYDLNNRLHSLWRDQAWRRATVRLADVQATDVVLDVACGTGDLAMAFAAQRPKHVVGVDFTFDMLSIAAQKHAAAQQTGAPIDYATGDAMRLPVADRSVDIVSIAFGIRNVAQPSAAITEFHRVLRPGGRLLVLEFSLPRNRVLRSMYNTYFQHVLPRTASLVARDRSGAYKYLPKSVNTFIDRQTLVDMMTSAGFADVQVRPLTFGVAVVYRGMKQA